MLPGIEDPYRRIVESVRDYAIFLLDADGRVVTWGPGAERLKGYQEGEILGQHFSVFYPPDENARGVPAGELRVAAAEGRYEDEGWRRRKDGSRFWANVVITALRDEAGAVRGFCKITRDLSHRRQREESLRESEERFRMLVEGVRDYAIYMLDREGRVASWNAGAERIKGYSAAEVIGRHFSLFYTEEGRRKKWPEQELQQARELGRYEDEGLRVRKDGSTFWAHIVLTPVYGGQGELRGYAKVTRDLTDRRRIEALEKAQRQTNEFLAMLAHELRNPLAPIRNALHLLSKKPTTDAAELWVRDVLQRQTVQMTRLVDDLLDVSRMTRSTVSLNRAPADIGRVVRDAVDASMQWIEAKQHALDLELPPERLEIEVDAVRINQVMQNLIHNAAKFTPNGGRVAVSVRREGDEVVFSVKDNGQGMSRELRDTAFELFRQGQQGLDRAEGGLGVGLTLVQRLVMLHGGTVEAHSEGPGKGSEFVVRLPVRQPGSPDGHVSAQAPLRSDGGQRVLVVDDNLDAANALRYLLENDGHEVRLAADGASGLALAREFRPHIILLDIGLPKLNGYQLAQEVRADPALREVTIIAVTGYGQPEDRERAAAAGIDYHLTKPVEFQSLQRLFRVVS
ncbi:MAG TPA: PAS domain S-box protein [Burkholderiales bacterium]|nr:PAS domain S-box protein [Burkholderiales bacterium]